MKKYLNFRRFSFLITILPFFTEKLINSESLSISIFVILLLLIIIVDFLVYLTISMDKAKLLSSIIIGLILVFFYYSFILTILVKINEYTLNLKLRAKYILPVTFGITTYFFFINRKIFEKIFYISNIFFLSLCLLKIIDEININMKIKSNYHIGGKNISIKQENKKPVILIITDEYASPIELSKTIKDSTIFNFQNSLLDENWVIKNNMYTRNTSTLNSLNSIFNFNINKNDNQITISNSISNLKESILYDSLENKNIKFYNFGIFDIGATKAKYKIYYNENDLEDIKDFFRKTLIYSIIYSGKESLQNKLNIENIEYTDNFLNTIDTNSFIYIHLLMPHLPYEYYSSKRSFVSDLNKSKLENYIEYWKYTNQSLTLLLSKITKNNRFRVILTGDHGLRDINNINPHYTFTAFYGFEKESIKNINTVQDIGNLIISSY